MQLIVIGVWNGNFSDALAIITPYHTEIKIWLVGKRLCLEDETIDFFFSVMPDGNIKIPRQYEPDFDRTVFTTAPEESFVWSDLDLLEQDHQPSEGMERKEDS